MPPEWNVKVLTESDFWTHADALKIRVREVQLEQDGYSEMNPKRRYIYIHDELRGVERLYALWHEMGHHWCHSAHIQFFLGTNPILEAEAEVIAVCALIPRTILPPRFAWSEIQELYGYPQWMLNWRWTVFRKWRI